MNYAMVENGIVVNVIILYPVNAADFPSAVPCRDIPAAIGDTYDGQYFYRDGIKVVSALAAAQQEEEDMQAALAELGVTVDG